MTYRKYFKTILISFFACWLLFCTAAVAQIGASTPGAKWINSLYTAKLTYGQSINDSKLVLVAGSSALFGISASTIEAQLQQPTVNLGTHAGLGIDYILNQARKALQPGDTVLLVPEYELYQANYKRSNTLVGYVFAHDPGYILKHPHILTELSIERLLYGLAVKAHLLPDITKDGYQSKDLTLNGDSTANKESNITAKEQAALANLTPFPLKSTDLNKRTAFQKLDRFTAWCQQNNIKVIASWPNTTQFATYQDQKYLTFFEQITQFYQARKIEILGTPQEFMYAKSYFFDTIYHLHNRGVAIRTQQLIALLKQSTNSNPT